MLQINFTLQWRRDGISYLQIIKKGKFPRFEITSSLLNNNNKQNLHTNELSVGDKLFKKWHQKSFPPPFSIQQWPSLDGQSASAIIYFDSNYLNYDKGKSFKIKKIC